MLALHSAKVGIGRELGRANGGREGGSRNIWWETLLCLYLWPRLWPMFDLTTGDLAMAAGWKLKGSVAFPRVLCLSGVVGEKNGVLGEMIWSRSMG